MVTHSSDGDRTGDSFQLAREAFVSDIGLANNKISKALAFCLQIRKGAVDWLAAASRDTFTEELCGPSFQNPVGQMRILVEALHSELNEATPAEWVIVLSKIKTLAEVLAERSGLATSHEMRPFVHLVYHALDATILAVSAHDLLGRLQFNEAIKAINQVSMNFAEQPSTPQRTGGPSA